MDLGARARLRLCRPLSVLIACRFKRTLAERRHSSALAVPPTDDLRQSIGIASHRNGVAVARTDRDD